MSVDNATYFAIDWGSTNFRLFGLDARHKVVFESQAPLGVFQINGSHFADVLSTHLAQISSRALDLPIAMAGMIGSRSGWFDVPYVSAPNDIDKLRAEAHLFDLPWGPKAFIIPGMSCINDAKARDVMRGEEVQLFGLLDTTNSQYDVAILPGTHSKHVLCDGKSINHFSTFFTGEMYQLLSEHSSVRPPSLKPSRFFADAFVQGVTRSQQGHFLSNVFSARTVQLFSDLPDEQIADFLSGILIGHELKSVAKNARIALIGGEKLCQRYQMAASALSLQTDIHCGDRCFLHGMSSLVKEMNFDRSASFTN